MPKIFKTFIAVITLASCASSMALSLESECPQRLEPTSVKVVTSASNINYDFTKSITELTQRGKRQRQLGQVVLGLTETTMKSRVSWKANTLTHSESKKSCLRPVLTVELDVNPQTVFVAKEFPRGTCAFDEIVRHELRHVHANQNAVERAAMYLQKELEEFFGQKVYYGDGIQLRNQLDEAIRVSWLPRAQEWLSLVDKDHNEIDSPAEYARSNTFCNSIVPKVVKAAGAH